MMPSVKNNFLRRSGVLNTWTNALSKESSFAPAPVRQSCHSGLKNAEQQFFAALEDLCHQKTRVPPKGPGKLPMATV